MIELPENIKKQIAGVILCGGRGQRMGGSDKGLVVLQGNPLVEYAINILRPQVGELMINANRNQETYRRYGMEVVSDIEGGFLGPLAGLASAMRTTTTELLVGVPCDSPLLPADLVVRLYKKLSEQSADIAVASSGDRLQPVFCLLRVNLLSSLLDYLSRGERKIDRWYNQHVMVEVDFSDTPQSFLNVNQPQDCDEVEKFMGLNG